MNCPFDGRCYLYAEARNQIGTENGNILVIILDFVIDDLGILTGTWGLVGADVFILDDRS